MLPEEIRVLTNGELAAIAGGARLDIGADAPPVETRDVRRYATSAPSPAPGLLGGHGRYATAGQHGAPPVAEEVVAGGAEAGLPTWS